MGSLTAELSIPPQVGGAEASAFAMELVGAAVDKVTSYVEPHALVLWGSFSRGEASILIEKGTRMCLNDIDFVLVTPQPVSASTRQAIVQGMPRIDIKCVTTTGMRRLPARDFGTQTLRSTGLVVRGDSGILSVIRPVPSQSLVLSSALVDLFDHALPKLLASAPGVPQWDPELQARTYLAKASVDCYRALQILHGEYAPGLSGRDPRTACPEDLALGEWMADGIEFKLEPRRPPGGWDHEAAWTLSREMVLRVLGTLVSFTGVVGAEESPLAWPRAFAGPRWRRLGRKLVAPARHRELVTATRQRQRTLEMVLARTGHESDPTWAAGAADHVSRLQVLPGRTR